jgi:26S proteasome regulatory subunit N1
MRKQLSYFLARSQVPLHWVHTGPEQSEPETEDAPPAQPDDIVAALGNQNLSKHFRNFGKAVGVFDAKLPADIYKLHLESGRAGVPPKAVESHRDNLASTYVNAFVNAGFGNDKLMVDTADGQSWIYANKNTGMQAATASVGMSMLWDGESGVDHIDKYSYSSEEQIKAGALFATGIIHAGIRGEPDLAWALLEDHIKSQSKPLKVAAMMGVAVSHANWRREDIAREMIDLIAEDPSVETSALAALTCAFTYVGSADGELGTTIAQTLQERTEQELDSPYSIFYAVALGLVYMGKFLVFQFSYN